MTFSVDLSENIRLPDLPAEEIFRTVAEEALRYTGCPYECEVSLTLTDDDTIREMNRIHRGIDKATDVLSFPFIDFASPADFKGLDPDSGCFDLDTDELVLGDIVISVDHVVSQAEEYGHSVKREFAFLIAHSMLHLQGFDHNEPDEAGLMEKAQNEILDSLGIRR